MTIVGLTAAHIADEQHFKCFKNCLLSIKWQAHPLDYFGLSWSCEDSFYSRCKDAVDSLANDLAGRCLLNCAYSPQKISQFRHYERLANWLRAEIPNPSVARILFGDSDDIWGPQRVAMTRQKVMGTSKTLVFPYFIAEAGYSSNLSSMDDEICHLSKCHGACNHVPLELRRKLLDFGDLSPEEGSVNEYWQYCCTVDLLLTFFVKAVEFDRTVFFPQFASSMLDFQYCDLALGAYLQRLNDFSLVEHEPGIWYYLKWTRFGETYLKDTQGGGVGKQSIAWRKKVTTVNFPCAVDVDSIDCTSFRTLTQAQEDMLKQKPVSLDSCAHCCLRSKTLMRCGRCKLVLYCGKECQKAHWKTHKHDCKSVL